MVFNRRLKNENSFIKAMFSNHFLLLDFRLEAPRVQLSN